MHSASLDVASPPTAARLKATDVVLLALMASLPFFALYWWNGFRIVRWPMEVSGFPLARDFANIWAAGKAALGGTLAALYDHAAHAAALRRLLDPAVTDLVWSYPPTSLWLGIPFSVLPYGLSIACWSAAGLAAITLARMAGQAVAENQQSRSQRLAGLYLAPGTLLCLACGQTALITSGLLVGGLALATRRPWLSGLLLGSLVVKPHLGLVVPVVLLALGAWRTMAATAVWAGFVTALTVLVFGTQPWLDFQSITLPWQVEILHGVLRVNEMLTSPHFFFRQMGLDAGLAFRMHSALAAVVLCVTGLVVRRTRDEALRLAVPAVATLLISPYLQVYEMALAALVAVRLAGHLDDAPGALRLSPPLLVALGMLVAAPVIGIISYNLSFVNVTAPLVLLAFALLAWQALLAPEARTVSQ